MNIITKSLALSNLLKLLLSYWQDFMEINISLFYIIEMSDERRLGRSERLRYIPTDPNETRATEQIISDEVDRLERGADDRLKRLRERLRGQLPSPGEGTIDFASGRLGRDIDRARKGIKDSGEAWRRGRGLPSPSQEKPPGSS